MWRCSDLDRSDVRAWRRRSSLAGTGRIEGLGELSTDYRNVEREVGDVVGGPGPSPIPLGRRSRSPNAWSQRCVRLTAVNRGATDSGRRVRQPEDDKGACHDRQEQKAFSQVR